MICASTGNTAASAAAYAARGGAALRGDRAGGEDRDRQARPGRCARRAGDRAARQLRPRRWQLVRELADRHPMSLVNSVNEFRIEGQKTAAFEIAEALDGELDGAVHPGRQRRQHHRLLARAFGRRARAPGCSASRPRARRRWSTARPVEHPETVASAIRIGNPARWEGAMDATTSSGGAIEAVSDAQILAAYRLSGGGRGDLLRAGVGGERRRAARARRRATARRIVCVLTGHGLKDPQTALEQARGVVACDPELRRVERAVLEMTLRRRRLVRVPASSANLGPGFDVLAAAIALHLEVEVQETGSFAVVTELDVPLDRSNLVVRGFERLHPADAFEFRIASEIPLSGGLGSSAAAIVAGLLAADHMFELDADVLALGDRARGASRQRRGGARGGLRRLPGDAGPPVRAADGARGGAGRPVRAGRDRGGACRAAGQRPARRRGVQRRRGRDADARAGRGPTGT